MGFRPVQDGVQRPKPDFSYGKKHRGPIASVLIPSIQILGLFCFVRLVMLKMNVFVFGKIPLIDPVLQQVIHEWIPYLEKLVE